MWGEHWGTMIWGGVAVPVLGLLGLVMLGAVLCLTARRWTPGRPQRWRVAALVLAVGLPLAVLADTVVIPHVFSNGTVADAVQVNANFNALVVESNAQDARIGALEAAPGVSGYEIQQRSIVLTGTPAGLNNSADCPAGKRAVGGGYRLSAGVTTLRIDISAPLSDGSGWQLSAFLSGFSPPLTFTIQAVCVTGS